MDPVGHRRPPQPAVSSLGDEYPLCLPRGQLDADDLHQIHGRLLQLAPDLFVDREMACHVDVRLATLPPQADDHLAHGRGHDDDVSPPPKGIASVTMSSPETIANRHDLCRALQPLPPGCIQILSIYRLNSWSRIKITLDMFQMLCSGLRITPRFIQLIQGMRCRTAPGDEHFVSCYYAVDEDVPEHVHRSDRGRVPRTQQQLGGFEVCYNIRHYEKHGRDLADPWSCRQSVVYQRCSSEASQSRWVLVQPTEAWQRGMDDLGVHRGAHPLALHLRSISYATASNWEYLEQLHNRLQSLDMRTAFQKPLSQIDVTFSTSQEVYYIRRKLLHMRTILDGTQRIVGALTALANSIRDPAAITHSASAAFLRHLACVSSDLEAYQSTTSELLSQSADIRSAIDSIINLRNQDVLNAAGTHLHRLAEDSAAESKWMAEIGQRTYADSRTVRIATIIALMYLPASLVLTFFSTVFVDIQASNRGTATAPGGEQPHPPRLVVNDQIWVLFVSMIALSIGTGSLFWMLERTQPLSRVRTSS